MKTIANNQGLCGTTVASVAVSALGGGFPQSGGVRSILLEPTCRFGLIHG